MRIHVVGGGPGGLFFALQWKKAFPRGEVRVFERNPDDATFGWGVVFSRRTLEGIEAADPLTVRRALDQAWTWEDVVIRQGDSVLRVAGNSFAGIERLHLLRVLQSRCREVGVELTFGHAVHDVATLFDADLVVGADGVRSLVREHIAEQIQARVEPRENYYVWLGTRAPFDGLTLTFRHHQGALFIGHSYRYCSEFSTFIVEVPAATYAALGLGSRALDAELPLLQEVFAPELCGSPLLDKASRWIRFQWVHCERWTHGNVVLLGDACHTAHYSIGSGTKLAMEDALALAEALRETNRVAPGLELFQQRRKPVVDALQAAAWSSLVWFESVARKMPLHPYEFAMDCMTRSDRLDIERVRRRDPAFVAAYEACVPTAGQERVSSDT